MEPAALETTVEHERKLDAPAGFRLPPLDGRPLEPRLFSSVYYDVPDGSLAGAGITLRRRTEHGRGVWQLKHPAAGTARLELEAPGGPLEPPEPLRRLLVAHLRHGPLAPVAELRTCRRGELVARNGTTAEVTVDEVSVIAERRVASEFVEVEIELRSGEPERLDEIAGEIVRAGARPSAGTPKLFRVLDRDEAAAPPAGPFEELRGLLGIQLREIVRHDPGTRLGEDPESLHDMRVAVRRSRALLRAGRTLVAGDTGPLRDELRWLGGVLGAVRDLDVLLGRLHAEAEELGPGDAAAARQLLGALEAKRARERDALLRALDGGRYLALLDRVARELAELEPSGADVSLRALARRELKRLRKAVRALPPQPADVQLHDLRKRGKRARYAAELAGRTRLVRRAKELQDVLGDHQDGVVAEERLRALSASAPPAQALAAGRLVERERSRRAAARTAWPKAWRRLEKAAR